MRTFLFSALCISGIFSAQEIVNPKGNFFLGAEVGINTIDSFELEESNKSIEGGILAEYYFAKQWSVVGRIKYFKTGLSFYNPNTHSGSWFDLGHDESYGTFNGAVISIPINIKWEFQIYKNLRGNLKMGGAYNFETKSDYQYSSNFNTDYPKQFASFNFGYGLNYFIDEKTAVYLDYEGYIFGGNKGSADFLLGSRHYNTTNSMLQVGVKFNLKSDKK